MAEFTFKSSTNSSKSYLEGKIVYSIGSTNTTENTTSSVTATIYVRKGNDSMTLTQSTSGSWSYSLSINGNSISGSYSASVLLNWVKVASHTINNIAHNNDGTKTITISGSVGAPSSTSYTGLKASGSQDVDLTTIPRASSITSASNVTLGNTCNVKWTPLASRFAYKLKFVCGSVSFITGYISPSTTSAYAYAGYTMSVATWAKAMPSSYSGICTVTLYTYTSSSSSTAIGSDSTTFKLTLPSSIRPTISDFTATLVDGWQGNYVQGMSRCTLSASFAAGTGSSISSCSISGTGLSNTGTGTSLSGTTSVLTGSGTITYTAKVTDGRTTVSASKSIVVYPYASPTISITATRTSTSGTVNVAWRAACSSINGSNYIESIRIYSKLSTDSTWSLKYTFTTTSSTSSNASQNLTGYDASSSFDFRVVVIDACGEWSAAIASVPSEFRILNINKDKKGLSIGKMSEDDIFDCALPAQFLSTVEFGKDTCKGLLKTAWTNESDGDIRNIVYIQTGQAVDGGATMGLAIHNASVYVENDANSGKVNLGSSGRKWNQLYAANSTISTSDRNVKTDINKMSDVQEQLFNELQPVTYKLKNGTSGRIHYGFISQDVEDALSDLKLTGQDFAGFCKDLRVDDNGDAVLDESGNKIYDYSLRYSEFIALNTYMIQKLQAENIELRTEIQELKEMIATSSNNSE